MVLPHLELIRVWDGVLFIREGIYAGAIFKFRMTFPKEYPRNHPEFQFLSDVFHPLVDGEGNLDMREFFNTTTKSKHTSLNILKFVKNIFLLNSYLNIETSNNKEAGKLFNSNYESFKDKAR